MHACKTNAKLQHEPPVAAGKLSENCSFYLAAASCEYKYPPFPISLLFAQHSSMAECKGREAVTWTDTILSDRFKHDALQPQLQLMLMCQQQISQPVACVQNG